MREVTAATSSLRANFHSPFRRLWHIFDRPEMVVVESRRRERERRREEEEGGGVSGESTHDFYLNRYCHRDRVLNVRPLMNLEIRFRNWIKTRWHARCSEQRRDTKGREGQMERGKRLPPMFWQWNFGQKLPLVSRLRIPRQCLGSPSVLASLSCLIGTYIWSEESPLYYHQSKYFSFLLSFRSSNLSSNFIFIFRPSLTISSPFLDFADTFSNSFRGMFETRYRSNLCTRKKNLKGPRSLTFCLF